MSDDKADTHEQHEAEIRFELRTGFSDLHRDLADLRKDLSEPLAAARNADLARAKMHDAITAFITSKAGTAILSLIGLVVAFGLAKWLGVLDPVVSLISAWLVTG